ncbi:MAG: hypothetical protein M1814_003962 [Vezdaea aestivalis]|nr:MAG: hypothetical protein M1814_003962 [Vezdaea aestivalis]
MESYTFPVNRLKAVMDDAEREPLCLVACGSFSPITYLHLRMFEMARDFAKFKTNFEIVGGYLSPVSDAYKKKGLAKAEHRIAMCDLAATETSKWLMVDPWEALQSEYQPTAEVLDHFKHHINEVHGGVQTRKGGPRRPVRIALLAGADLIETMSTPGVWSQPDLERILGGYGSFIVERAGTDIDAALAGLSKWEHNIWVIRQLIQNDVSSTKIRDFLVKGLNVKYLIPGQAIDYIETHDLYRDGSIAGPDGLSKEAASTQTTDEAAQVTTNGHAEVANGE